MPGTWIVVPCFNEADRLPVSRFLDHVASRPGRSFLFVDDGSTDGTGDLLESLVARQPRQLHRMSLERNRGKAEAVRNGVLQALDHAPDRLGYLDADLSTPLEALDDLDGVLDERPEVDLVMGARVALLGRRIARSPVRHYLGRVFATGASLVLSLPVYDTQCGAKLFRVGAGTAALFRDPFLTRWIFDVEILARMGAEPSARPLLERVYEFPLREWRDVQGSKVKPGDFLTAGIELFRIRRRYPPGGGAEEGR